MQGADFGLQIIETGFVDDHVIGNGQPLLARRLCRQDTTRAVRRLTVPCCQAGNLCLLEAVNDENTVDKSLQRRLHKQRYHDDNIRAGGGFGLPPGFVTDTQKIPMITRRLSIVCW